MKEDGKPNPQYSDSKLDGNSENGVGKRLEDKPGAFLLKETAEDEEINQKGSVPEPIELNEEAIGSLEADDVEFNDDVLNPFEEDEDEDDGY